MATDANVKDLAFTKDKKRWTDHTWSGGNTRDGGPLVKY